MPTKEQTVLVIDRLLEGRDSAKANADNPIFRSGSYCIDVERLAMQEMRHDEAREILAELRNKGCFVFENRQSESEFSSMVDSSFFRQKPANVVFLKIGEVHSLRLFECRQELLGKKGNSTIKPVALEHIARKMGDSDSANGLIKVLRDCNVPSYLIVYPNTKWRMVDDIFRVLATSTDDADHQLLFKIMEECCHPLHFGGDKARAQEMQDHFSQLLEYDGYCFGGRNKIIKLADLSQFVASALLSAIAERKDLRAKSTAASMKDFDVLTALFGATAQPVRRSSPAQPKAEPQPINITIHNQNVQHPSASSGQPHATDNKPTAATTEVYTLNELQINLPSRVLLNIKTGDEHDLSGFNYDFLSTLIAAKGALVSYESIAKAAQTTVGTISSKSVMDRKSAFIKMLRTELGISAETCDELIQTTDGYRISRKIYE